MSEHRWDTREATKAACTSHDCKLAEEEEQKRNILWMKEENNSSFMTPHEKKTQKRPPPSNAAIISLPHSLQLLDQSKDCHNHWYANAYTRCCTHAELSITG